LETLSFQARGFYERYGYSVFGELDDFPPGHRKYFLKKNLSAYSNSHLWVDNALIGKDDKT
jgi:hypothetical protein